MLVRMRATFVRLLRAAGRRDEAEAQLRTALGLIDELCEEIADASLRETFSGRARALPPSPRAPSARRVVTAAASGLSAREREVARLIAAGNGNRAIAEALVLRERTVEGHVSSILNKLGFSSRSQIAVWAAGRRLDGSAPGRRERSRLFVREARHRKSTWFPRCPRGGGAA
jgi:non-specific serine/threonine protein kinase